MLDTVRSHRVIQYPHVVLTIGAILVDFDGTACIADVAEVLLDVFGGPGWRAYDKAVERGEMSVGQATRLQATTLRGSPEEMLAFAVEHCPLAPTLPAFVSWAEERGIHIALVSDGFGFYIEPILEAAGLALAVITNEIRFDGGAPRLLHPNGHPECIGCGTCKMLAVLRARESRGPTVFVGNGESDRYGALYADLVFAKDALTKICERDGVPYLPWSDFDGVREALESMTGFPGPVDPARCPGWVVA